MDEMLPDPALKSMNVMFATPCYISAVTMSYVGRASSASLAIPCFLVCDAFSICTARA